MPSVRSALVVSAHAADFVWRCGGAIALHAQQECAVTVLCLSFGERGESARLWKQPGMTLDKVKQARRDEAERAGRELGVHELVCLNLGDYPLEVARADKERIVEVMRAVAPDFILTHSQYDPYKTDHMHAMKLTLECRMIAHARGHAPGGPVPGAPQVYLFEPHQTEQMGWKPDTFLDITPVWERKRAAIECMQGQEHLRESITPVSLRTVPTISSETRAARPAGATAAMPKGSSPSFRAPSMRSDRHRRSPCPRPASISPISAMSIFTPTATPRACASSPRSTGSLWRPRTRNRPGCARGTTTSCTAGSSPATTPLSVIATLNLLPLAVIDSCIALACAEAASMEETMGVFAALDVSQEETAICVVRPDGALVAEAKVPTCPDAIADWLTESADGLERVGMETGPLAVWLWNALTARQVPIICLDARHASGVLKMMPNKTDRHDARGLAQIVRTGWFKAVQIKSHDAYVNRALLTAREALVGMRVRLENEIRGLLKTFGVMFGKKVGGFMRRAEEIIARDLTAAPELVPIFEALMQARRDILARIAALDSQIRATARQHATVRLLMTAPGVGPITAMAVVAAFDDAARFRRSSSAGACLGLTPRRYGSGEISRNGRVSKRGDRFTRKCLYEAANALLCRNLGDTRLRSWAKAVAERTGPRKAKVALARKLAVTLHAMWRTNTPFREAATA